MRAIVIKEPGGPEQLELREVANPRPGEGELLVEVRATALNRADLLQRRGLYPPPAGATDILGLECAGVVRELGPGASGAAVGQRVMALLPGGGYAEQVTLPAAMAIPIPERLSFEEAAAIPEAFLTAREALFTLGRLAPGETALIHAAAGGVGSAAVELAHRHGARVIATAGSAEKLALARELGAGTLVNYRTEDFSDRARSVTGGRGVDVVVDFIGASYWPAHAACMADGGRCVVVGVLGGAKATVNLGALLARRHQLLGLVMRSRSVTDKIAITRAFIRESLPGFATGALRPVIDRVFPLAEARLAHERMERNDNLGKIVLSIG
ncbi:MAG: NAD(P)H-quinone oxidoreductase [Sorangiineae bacterium]|nr:NAD(P)H-quinone oxidoreductase [Polyangiaceae bacterium]MEB2324327.1 NAD(P)H-quinone oxidoreductase [Sorangiineae bacterium]